MLVKRGAVTDRPWGVTLAERARDQFSGELVVIAEGKRYALSLSHGGITAALSPAAADSVGRIALTSHLVSSTQVAEITRRIAATPERDEIDVIAEVARLAAAQKEALRRRVITQRAARTFAIEQGTYACDDGSAIPKLAGGPIDAHTVIYLGARLHGAETRLTYELRTLGSRFVLRLDAAEALTKFGFTDAEKPIIAALRSGTSIAELEATHRELDPRMIAAVTYTLVTTGVCSVTTGPARRAESQAEPMPSRTLSPAQLVNARVVSKDLPTREPVAIVTHSQIPVVVSIPPAISRTMTPKPALATGSSPSHKRLAVQIPPLAVPAGAAPPHRAPTNPIAPARTATGTESPVVMRTPTKDRPVEWLDARDAFQRGEMAMRREQILLAITEFARAVELQPENGDYIATHAWAMFCAAIDKPAVADETRKLIDKALARTTDAVTPRMCLGRMERMLGRDKEALKSFQQVLELQPHNNAAASEARVLEARLRR